MIWIISPIHQFSDQLFSEQRSVLDKYLSPATFQMVALMGEVIQSYGGSLHSSIYLLIALKTL